MDEFWAWCGASKNKKRTRDKTPSSLLKQKVEANTFLFQVPSPLERVRVRIKKKTIIFVPDFETFGIFFM